MTTTTNTNTLRAAIEAAMRRRDPGVRVSVTPAAGQTLASVDGPSSALVWGSSMADTADEALRRLARGFGLRDDGSDPVADVERLTRERDEARASVNELASQQQRLMAMIGAQTAEKVRLLTDLAEARSALRDLAARCDASSCDEIATQREHTAFGARACDAHNGEFTSIPVDMMHAAALRAAGGGR